MKVCARCGKEVPADRRVSRGQTCPHCGAWLHSCVQCRFYSPGRQNDCAESMAEPVRDKESSNFCDFFEFADAGAKEQRRKKSRDEFDTLFGGS